MIRWEVALAFMIGLLFFGYLFTWGVVAVGTESACLAAGYPTPHTAWTFERYCTREENEYEVTVPLEQARGRQD